MNISMNLLILIFTMACLLQYLENVNNYELGNNLKDLKEEQIPVDSFDWLFFMCYTISLVGYGSYMTYDLSLIVILLILPVFFTVLPDQTGELVRLFQKRSVYARKSYYSTRSTPHIVLLGTVS